jgi:hypothetical protein
MACQHPKCTPQWQVSCCLTSSAWYLGSALTVFDMLRDQLHMVMYYATSAIQGCYLKKFPPRLRFSSFVQGKYRWIVSMTSFLTRVLILHVTEHRDLTSLARRLSYSTLSPLRQTKVKRRFLQENMLTDPKALLVFVMQHSRGQMKRTDH